MRRYPRRQPDAAGRAQRLLAAPRDWAAERSHGPNLAPEIRVAPDARGAGKQDPRLLRGQDCLLLPLHGMVRQVALSDRGDRRGSAALRRPHAHARQPHSHPVLPAHEHLVHLPALLLAAPGGQVRHRLGHAGPARHAGALPAAAPRRAAHQPRDRAGRALLPVEPALLALPAERGGPGGHQRPPRPLPYGPHVLPAQDEGGEGDARRQLPSGHCHVCRAHELRPQHGGDLPYGAGEPQDTVGARDAHAHEGHGAQVPELLFCALLHRLLQVACAPLRGADALHARRLLPGPAVAAGSPRLLPPNLLESGAVHLPEVPALVAELLLRQQPLADLLPRGHAAGARGHVGGRAAGEEGALRRLLQLRRPADHARLLHALRGDLALGLCRDLPGHSRGDLRGHDQPLQLQAAADPPAGEDQRAVEHSLRHLRRAGGLHQRHPADLCLSAVRELDAHREAVLLRLR
mmetsp:Transcript_84593/g.274040  ORF Transcript_84593/g.274040 Transcript_84593/m.274040 type:complete len:462 (-) Transcript_84593:398-1783(-)